MNYDNNNIFAKILRNEIPSKRLYEDDDLIVIADIAPAAPTHLLLIPKQPIISLADASNNDAALLGKMLIKAADIAREMGVDSDGYRVVINTRDNGGQTVPHLHIHLHSIYELAIFHFYYSIMIYRAIHMRYRIFSCH